MIKKTLLMTASAGALVLGGSQLAFAQTSAMSAASYSKDETERLRSETAELYVSTIAKLAEVIEADIRDDAGNSVISALRTGSLEGLPSMNADIRRLIDALQINAVVVDADSGAGVDERVVVFINDDSLKQGVTRADIELEAKRNGNLSLVRLQNGEAVGKRGSFPISEAAGAQLTRQGFGTWIGVSGNDKVTSSGSGSKEVRVLACEAGYYGTGITQERDNARSTNLGGTATESYSGWTEVARDCSAEYTERVRFFDVCAGPDGLLGTSDDNAAGQSLYEASQSVRKSPSDPFATEVHLDRSTAVLVDQAQCLSGARSAGSADFLVDGRTGGGREIQLRTPNLPGRTAGNGPGQVPVEANSGGSPQLVSSIPFPVSNYGDLRFVRSCLQEYGAVAPPNGFTALSQFNGHAEYYRDYNRRETYFSDNRQEYILNYDLVLDPNPYGHAPKGRGPVSSAHGAAPAGDGWYKFTETCERNLTHPQHQSRTRNCSNVHSGFPNGQISDARHGVGTYRQTTSANPAPNGPTLTTIAWGEWAETNNGCYRTSQSSFGESRTIGVNVGGGSCTQAQVRTRIQTTNTFMSGASNTTTTYAPNWTNSGGPTNCQYDDDDDYGDDDDGPKSIDVDGDGYGDFDSSWRGEKEAKEWAKKHGKDPRDFDKTDDYCGRCDGPPRGSGRDRGRDDDDGDSGGGGCFAPDTLVLMADGSEKRIDQVNIGDHLAHGGVVLVTGSFLSDDVYHLDGVRVTGLHIVKSDAGWVRVKDHPRAVREVSRLQKTCNLVTTNNRMVCGGTVFADQMEYGGSFLEEVLLESKAECLEDLNSRQDARQFA